MAMIGELLRHLFKRPFTVKYPFERRPKIEGVRGRIEIDLNKCIGCGLCAKMCPSSAITIEGRGREAKLTYYVGKCLFCGLCAEVCPRKAIEITEEREIASEDEAALVVVYKKPKGRVGRR